MEILHLIAKEHDKWVDTCKLFGVRDYPEDLVQDMYIRISKAKNVTKSNYKGYVYVTLRNLCYDRHKKKRHDLEINAEITNANISTDSRLLWLDIQQALHDLPYFERQVIQLHNIEGISLREINRETDVCCMRMSRAKQKGIDKIRKWINK